jgi:hypothetical protein
MVTRKLFTPGMSLAVGLLAGLLAQQASAAEQPTVNGTAAAVAISVDAHVFKQGIESYIRTVNEELKVALEQNAKRAIEPKLELASADARERG